MIHFLAEIIMIKYNSCTLNDCSEKNCITIPLSVIIISIIIVTVFVNTEIIKSPIDHQYIKQQPSNIGVRKLVVSDY